jgi:hypothetical protein
MRLSMMFSIFFLLFISLIAAGCVVQTSENVSGISNENLSEDQSLSAIDSSDEFIFKTVEYNFSQYDTYYWLNGKYETVIVDFDLFKESASNEIMELELPGDVVELELKEVPVPEGASKVSLANGPDIYVSESEPDMFIFEGKVAGNTNSYVRLIGSESGGYLSGEINTDNKDYHIMATQRYSENKRIHVIYVSEYQSGYLVLKINPGKSEFNEGENFDIQLTLTNTGNNTLNVWKMYDQISCVLHFKLLKNNVYSDVDYTCGVIERVPMMNDGLVELKPGESLSTTFNSRCWDLDTGKYALSATYHTLKGESITEPYWLGSVESNTIMITIE